MRQSSSPHISSWKVPSRSFTACLHLYRCCKVPNVLVDLSVEGRNYQTGTCPKLERTLHQLNGTSLIATELDV
eukprot:1183916-Prorocentrum_minimum.AAC.3